MSEPWRSIGAWADHWQSLLAGALAIVAAIITVIGMRGIERAKAVQETNALRMSMALELRRLIPAALGVHVSLRKLAQKQNAPITVREIECLSYLPEAILFRSSIAKIAQLGSDAMNMRIVYDQIEGVRSRLEMLKNYRTPDDVSAIVVAGVANVLIATCEFVRTEGLLSKVRTGLALHDDKDDQIARSIEHEAANWQTVRKQWPGLP
jgi:hypothetical protein